MNDHPLSILVVDDEEDACRNMADILGDFGYIVDVAYDGHSALKLVQHKTYDAALLDLRMPEMDGLTLYRKIKEMSAGTAAVLVTAHTSKAIAGEALDAGMLQVLPKPVDLGKLMKVLERALERPCILLVDDDAELCLSLRDLLKDHGYRFCMAHNLLDASVLLDSLRFDVVLIDMKLPEGDGYGVYQKVREVDSQVHVIAITGYRAETEPLIRKLVSAGADAVCYKPFNVPELLATLGRLSRLGNPS